MRVPGFAAEASLGKAGIQCRSATSGPQGRPEAAVIAYLTLDAAPSAHGCAS
jgi:hypothetical protein